MPGQMLGSPVFDRFGHIYVGISQSPRGMEPRGLLVCVDGNSHKVRWEYRAAGPVESTPVIGDDDVIYFGDNAGVIHAVNFLGRVQWTAQVGSPVRSAGTILAPHRLAFGLDNETLLVLECSSAGLAPEGWPKIGRTRAKTARCSNRLLQVARARSPRPPGSAGIPSVGCGKQSSSTKQPQRRWLCDRHLPSR